MKQIRKIARNPLVIFPLVGCFAFVSCKKEVIPNGGSNGNSNIVIKSNSNYSGENFYDGIFLRKGELVNQIASFDGMSTIENLDLTSAELAEINAGIDLIKAEVQNLNPTYFDNLKTAIYSNDHISIEEQLKIGSSLTITAIENIEQFNFVNELRTNTELQQAIVDRIGTDDLNNLYNNPTREEVAEIQSLIAGMVEYEDIIDNAQCIVLGVVLLVAVGVVAAAAAAVVTVGATGIVIVNEVGVEECYTENATVQESGGTEEGGDEAGGGIAAPTGGGSLWFEGLVDDLVVSF